MYFKTSVIHYRIHFLQQVNQLTFFSKIFYHWCFQSKIEIKKKLKYAEAVIPKKALKILCSLHSLQVGLWAYGEAGFSIYTSVQSVIILVFRFFLKERRTASLLSLYYRFYTSIFK